MKFISISKDFFNLCKFDKELLHNKDEKRPYLVIVKLKYRNKKIDFAIPFRSNIPNYVPKEHYFSLPPRYITKDNHIHGLHYIKMFPVKKEFFIKFNTDKDNYYKKIENIITTNIKQIVFEAQEYLDNYIIKKPKYCTSIDKIFYVLYSPAYQEVASDNDTNGDNSSIS